MVPRPRIDELFKRGSRGRMILVSAGPGAGKSVAVAAWLASAAAPGPVAWCQLDETDNDPPTLWRDIVAALQQSGSLADAPPGLVEDTDLSHFGLADVRWIADRIAARDGPVVLVLDDAEEVTNTEALQGLNYLVARNLPTLLLVVVTRADPPLRLHPLRMAGDLVEVREADLAFEVDEAEELFEAHGLALDARARDALMTRTEGWAAGLRLALMFLEGSDVDAAIRDFTGDNRTVAEYLVSEVLAHQSPTIRHFLLHTSVAERLSGDLADALTERTDGQRQLERLARENALVSAVDESSTWFRFHPLLRELMVHLLMVEDAAAAKRLYRTATVWFNDHGMPITAIRHAVAGDDWAMVRRLLVEAALPVLLSPRRGDLVAALRPAVARARAQPSCDTLVAAAACHFFDRSFTALQEDLHEANQLLPQVAAEDRPSVLLAVRLFEIGSARVLDPASVVDTATTVLGLLDRTPAGATPAARQYRTIAAGSRAAAYVWMGRFAEAREELAHVVADAAQLDLELPRVNAVSHLAVIDALQGRLDDADRAATHVRAVAAQRGWWDQPQVLGAYVAGALVGLNRDDLGAARRHAKFGTEASYGQSDAALTLALRTVGVHIDLAAGELAAAQLATARLREETGQSPPPAWLATWLHEAELRTLLLANRAGDVVDALRADYDDLGADLRLLLARAQLTAGQRPEAEATVRDLLAQPTSSLAAHVGGWLATAVIADLRRDDAGTIEALRQATALAAPEQLRGPFRDFSTALHPLLVRHQEAVAGIRPLAHSRDGAPTTASAATGDDLVEPLTRREVAVLNYLPTMLTNEEIGDSLFVSVNTVKAHLKSLYRKLGVRGRREAVRRARALGLL